MESSEKTILKANEFQLVDKEGRIRASLATSDQGVSLSMMSSRGVTHLKLMVDESGLSFLKLFDGKSENEKVDISLDDKGTHLFLAGEGKQQSYLFLKNNGASGVVLVDKAGDRKAQVLLSPEGDPDVSIYPKNQESKSI